MKNVTMKTDAMGYTIVETATIIPNRFGKPEANVSVSVVRLPNAPNGDFRWEHTKTQFQHEHKAILRFDGSVYMWEIENGEVRVLSLETARENGVDQMPQFDARFQDRVYQADTKALLENYRLVRRDYKPSDEEMFEMAAAFGPGAEVVDIITGQKFRTPGTEGNHAHQFTLNPAERFAASGGTENPLNSLRKLYGRQPHVAQAHRVARRESAAVTLNKIEAGDTVTFPYDDVIYTATVDSVNQTTATVTITKIDGRPRSKKRTVGTKVRVSAGILARSL